jgi:hypothetical protein
MINQARINNFAIDRQLKQLGLLRRRHAEWRKRHFVIKCSGCGGLVAVLTEKQVDKWKERYGGVPPVQFCHKCVWEGVPGKYEFCKSANTKRIECALLEKVSS